MPIAQLCQTEKRATVRGFSHLIAAGMWAGSLALAQEAVPTFGSTVVVPGGLIGAVYYIPPSSSSLPDFRRLWPVGTIYASSLNVPTRNFLEGFPGITRRYEWFAIDYTGRFWIQRPGEYEFALTSDDGAKLYIDDRLVVNNDGVHPTQLRMGSARLTGGIHRIRVSYFQGPREEVALILQIAGPGENWRIFSTDEFRPPPNPETWAFPDAEHGGIAAAKPELRISSTVGSAGDQIAADLLLDLQPSREVTALEWELIVPAQLLELAGEGPRIGRAAAEAGKQVSCTQRTSYLYACTLTGGQNPLVSGPIATLDFKIRPDAPSKTTALRIGKVEATASDGRKFELSGAEGTVTIR